MAVYVGMSILVTYIRFADWYDAARQLGYGVPFYFSYVEGAIRGGSSGVIASGLIFIVFRRSLVITSPRVSQSTFMVVVAYFLTIGLILLMQPQAYDPGLIIDLMLIGLVAAASTFLYGQSLKLEKEAPILDKCRQIKWIELEHKQTMDIITTLAWMIVFAIAVMGYNSFFAFWQALSTKYGETNPVAWRTFTVAVLQFSFVATGIAAFIMAPLFLKLSILKNKLKKTEPRSRVPFSSATLKSH